MTEFVSKSGFNKVLISDISIRHKLVRLNAEYLWGAFRLGTYLCIAYISSQSGAK